MSLVWEPDSDNNRGRSRDLRLVFQPRSEAAAKRTDAQDEAVASNEKVPDPPPSNKPAKILRMRY